MNFNVSRMKKKSIRLEWTWLVVGFAITGVAVAVNWNTVKLAVAVAASERRPALLNDADWDEPASASKFLTRFQAGTRETALIEWLDANDFRVNREISHASRLVRSLPCNERIARRGLFPETTVM